VKCKNATLLWIKFKILYVTVKKVKVSRDMPRWPKGFRVG